MGCLAHPNAPVLIVGLLRHAVDILSTGAQLHCCSTKASTTSTCVQHSTAQHSTPQHSTAQHSTAQHSTAWHGTAQHGTSQHSTGQPSPAQPWHSHITACAHQGRCVRSYAQHLDVFNLGQLRNAFDVNEHSLHGPVMVHACSGVPSNHSEISLLIGILLQKPKQLL